MHRFVVLVAFKVASVLALNEACLMFLGSDAINCCKSPIKGTKPPQYNEMAQCFNPKNPEQKCEIENCVAIKGGFLTDDGKIDKKAYGAIMSESYKGHPELVDKMMKNCINADVKEYGPPDDCEVNKIGECLNLQFGMSCPKFQDHEKCSRMKDLVETCLA